MYNGNSKNGEEREWMKKKIAVFVEIKALKLMKYMSSWTSATSKQDIQYK